MSESQAIEATIPQDLQEKVNALRAIATTYNLLNEGSFKFNTHEAIKASQEFLKALHAGMSAEALAHPDADLVPELKVLKTQGE